MKLNTPETDAYERDAAEDVGSYFGEDSTREAYEFARKLERRLNWLLAFHNSTAGAGLQPLSRNQLDAEIEDEFIATQ